MEMEMDMEYNLIIKDFGKIKEADIHVSPLTLFVGDNNSGKSYLLSLIWALRSLSASSPFFHDIKGLEHPALQKIKEQLIKLIEKGKSQKTVTSEFSSKNFIDVFNALCENSKDAFVSSIFNDSVHIGFLKIHMADTRFAIKFQKRLEVISFEFGDGSQGIGFSDPGSYDGIMPLFCAGIICWLLGNYFPYETYFLPAARTGFMLSKAMINQYSRKHTFDTIPHKDQNVAYTVEPLTKPILHFLDTLENLSDKRTANERNKLVQWIEKEMIHGSVVQANDARQEIRYIPIEAKDSLSLRTSSSVVTELLPLIILLKNQPFLKTLCYETAFFL